MDVSDLLIELRVRVDVAIVPASPLPESIHTSCIPDPIKDRRIELHPAMNDPFRQAKFQCFQDLAHDPIMRLTHEQMRVIGHEYPRIKQKVMALSCKAELFNKHIPDRFCAEQIESLIC